MLNKKKTFATISLLIILTLVLSACTKKETGVIAKVNGKNIMLDNFNKEFEVLKNARIEQYGEDVLEKIVEDMPYEEYLKKSLLNMMIDETIVSQDLENLEIGVTDDEVNADLELRKSKFIANSSDPENGEAEYNKYLEEMGFTEEYLRTTIRRELMVVKHKEDFLNKIHLEEKDIEKYYNDNKNELEKIKLSHILVKDNEAGQKVLEKLNAGESFATVAATESLDTQTAAQGGYFGVDLRRGDLGGVGLGQLEEPAFALEVGKYSELIESDFGIHILYLEEKLTTLEDLKTDVINSLKYQKYIEKITQLKEAADVKILDKDFKFK